MPLESGASPASGSPTTNGSRRPAATSSAHASASASRALRASSASLSGGSDQTIASRRSPVPRPWLAEIAYVSSQPSEWNSAPSSSRFSLSALLTATITGAVARRRIVAASRSAGVIPVAASTTNTMTSACEIARRACSWTRISIGSSGSSSRPPVSTTMKRRPFHSASPYRRSRVVRARSSTIAVRPPTIRLKSVLFPTFGRPTIATIGIPALAPAAVMPRRTGWRALVWSSEWTSCARPGSQRARGRRGQARLLGRASPACRPA